MWTDKPNLGGWMILAAIGASTYRSNEVKISKISLEKWKFLCNIMAGVCCVGAGGGR